MLVDIMPLKILVSAGAPVVRVRGAQLAREILGIDGGEGGGEGQPIECQEF